MTNPSAGKPDNSDPKVVKTDVPWGVVVDEKPQDCKFWASGVCTRGDKCRLKYDPTKDRPHDREAKDRPHDRGTSKYIFQTIISCGTDCFV
jgi:hypothetical protein